MRAHWKMKITGRVQGVFFRQFCQEKAEELGLTGWVRNEPDGTVYLEAEGEEEVLEKLAELCRQGPKGARVASLEKTVGEVAGFKSFEIVYNRAQ